MIPLHTVLPINGMRQIQCSACGATALNTAKERNRFSKRHPGKCAERREFTRQLAEGVRSVEADGDTDGEEEEQAS